MRPKDERGSRWGQTLLEHSGTLPFFDRERESRRIEEALRCGESMMIFGPADIGKTALMLTVMRSLPRELSGKCIYIDGFKDLQDLLRNLLRALYQAASPDLFQQLKADHVASASFDRWLKMLPSSRLRGVLYRSVKTGDYRIILDHAPPLTHAMAKIIKELFWMRNTPVILVMRDDLKSRSTQFADFFYWSDRQCLTLGPLPQTSACELLEAHIEKHGLSRFDLEEFREEVLLRSGCVPGAIVKMCALAADPRYQYGSRIKTKLVHIDYLMSGSRRHSSIGRKSR